MAKFIGLFLISTMCLFAQVNTDTIQNTMQPKLDSLSLVVENLKREITTSNHYADILEKTNQQLSLWYNPYAIFVGALGILITLTTLFFAGYFFLQSRDHKQRMNELIESHKTALQNLITEFTAKREIIDKLIEESQRKLQETTEPEKLKQLEDDIALLKENRDALSIPIQVKLSDVPMSGWTPFNLNDTIQQIHENPLIFPNSIIECSNCHHKYRSKPGSFMDMYLKTKLSMKCPKCGTLNTF